MVMPFWGTQLFEISCSQTRPYFNGEQIDNIMSANTLAFCRAPQKDVCRMGVVLSAVVN